MIDYRRLSAAQAGQLAALGGPLASGRPPGYETMSRCAGPADPGMLARHEHRQAQRAAAGDDDGLALRRRQLELLRLAG